MLLAAVFFGTIWMVAQSLVPFAVGKGIQEGVVLGDGQQLLVWTAVLLGLGVDPGGHRLGAPPLRGQQLADRRPSGWSRSSAVTSREPGTAVQERLTTGEVVATVSNDALRAGTPTK